MWKIIDHLQVQTRMRQVNILTEVNHHSALLNHKLQKNPDTTNWFRLEDKIKVLFLLMFYHVNVCQRKDTQSCVTVKKNKMIQSKFRISSSVMNTTWACGADSTPGCCFITYRECTFRCVFLFWNWDLPPLFCFIITQSCAWIYNYNQH